MKPQVVTLMAWVLIFGAATIAGLGLMGVRVGWALGVVGIAYALGAAFAALVAVRLHRAARA